MNLVYIFAAVIITTGSAQAGEVGGAKRHSKRHVASTRGTNSDKCLAKIFSLQTSSTEGEDRLHEKQDVIDLCAIQFQGDQVVARLVKNCSQCEEDSVVSKQTASDCQIAAYSYAASLAAIKADCRSEMNALRNNEASEDQADAQSQTGSAQ